MRPVSLLPLAALAATAMLATACPFATGGLADGAGGSEASTSGPRSTSSSTASAGGSKAASTSTGIAPSSAASSTNVASSASSSAQASSSQAASSSTGAVSSSSSAASSSSSSSAASSSSSSSGTVGAVCNGDNTLIAGKMYTASGTTAGSTDQFSAIPTTAQPPIGDVCKKSSPPGPDNVYTVTPLSDGTLIASLGAGYAYALIEIRSACADDASDVLACAAGDMNAGQLQASASVTALSTYYVVVDDWNGQSGNYNLGLELQ